MVKFLLCYVKVDVNLKDFFYMILLYLVCVSGNMVILKMFFEEGVDIWVKLMELMIFFYIVVYNGNFVIVFFIL